VRDLDGTIIVGPGRPTLCSDFHYTGAQTHRRCLESITAITNHIKAGERHAVRRCGNGLFEAGAPIQIKGEHVANIFAAQFLLQSPDQDFFRRQAQRFGFDEDAYTQAAGRVPVIDEARLPALLDYLSELAKLLGEIGQGTTVKLSYIHGAKTLEKDFTIQQAPRDMLSAAKYKNDKLGLTVKDVTYEVRAALRLDPNEPAIVAVKVEQGTPAALARINTYELIRAVDSVSIDSVETFEKLLAQAQEAKKDSIRVTVEWMGKTRLADLKFEARAPAGMPGALRRSQQEP
jgi:ligand-binding sensor protein